MGFWLLLAICLQPLAADGAPADWPQFRGPEGQGHAEVNDLPLTWSDTENVAWRVPIPGRGWSSPVVLGEQVWMTSAIETAATPEEAKRRVENLRLADTLDVARHISLRAVAVHRRTGELLHDIPLFEIDDPAPVHEFNSFASPTPIIEPGRVYCHFGAFGTACIDTRTGQVLWKNRFVVDHEVGPGSSPILYKDLLVLVCDG